MTDEKRRCLAYLYASIIRPTKTYRNVYDSDTGQYYFFNATRKTNQSIMVFDYSRGGYMGGNLPNIYDYNSGSYISINQIGPNIQCFDYERGHHIRGKMTASVVTLFDYETGSYHKYKVS